jgi:hypothetical protein
VAGGEILRGGCGALIRHVHDVDAGMQLEQLRRDVAGCAVALRGIAELAGIGLWRRRSAPPACSPESTGAPPGCWAP